MNELLALLSASADCPRYIGGTRLDGSTCSTCGGTGTVHADDSWGVAS